MSRVLRFEFEPPRCVPGARASALMGEWVRVGSASGRRLPRGGIIHLSGMKAAKDFGSNQFSSQIPDVTDFV